MDSVTARFGSLVALLACVFIATGPSALRAEVGKQSFVRRTLPAVRAVSPPKIDGDLSDACWKDAPSAQTFLDQQQGDPAPDQTEAYMLYDARYIYVAFRCKDSRPDQIVARERVRDVFTGSTEDNVAVMLDPFLTHQRSDFARFVVNALGTRAARIGGGRANKAEWKGDWDAAAKRTTDGWTAEMRIPWAILNYPRRRAPASIGINFRRWQQHTKIESIWSNIGPQAFNELEGLWTQVQVPLTAFHPHLSLLPYTLSSITGSGASPSFGVDARYSISPELTSVASVNPDFGTVEGAVESITFSRSEQYVRDTRPFFLEGRGLFSSGTSGGILFYSNRIPSFDVGAKLYGKVTPMDTLAFLNTIQFGARNDTVLSLQHTLSPTATAGLYFNQMSATDDNNVVGEISGDSRWGKFNVGGAWALTGGRNAGGSAKTLSLNYADRRLVHSVEYLDHGTGFRAADGLIPFKDFKGFDSYEDYHTVWRKGYWQAFDASVGTEYLWHQDGRPFQRGAGINFNLNARRDWGVGLQLNFNRFDARTDKTIGFDVTGGISNRYRQWSVYFTTGTEGDRPATFVGPRFSLRFFRRWDVIYSAAIQNRDGVKAQHVLTVNCELSPTRALGARLVASGGTVNGYLSYRSSGQRGMNSYIILGDPNTKRLTKRISVKLVFAL